MVYELLKPGADNAYSSSYICSILGTTPRQLSKLIEQERRAGKPICASTDRDNPGYYLAADKEEMQLYCNRLWHRAGEIFKTRRSCLETIDRLPARESVRNDVNAN